MRIGYTVQLLKVLLSVISLFLSPSGVDGETQDMTPEEGEYSLKVVRSIRTLGDT